MAEPVGDDTAPNRALATMVTMGVAFLVLAIFGVVGASSLLAPVSRETTTPTDTTSEAPSCHRASGGVIAANQVTVSVYNASDRAGLATETMDELSGRGFQVGQVGNAPVAKLRYVQVWSTTQDDAAAQLVALQFGPKTVVRRGPDLGVGIDVVVGTGFKGLVAGAPSSISASEGQRVCGR